MTHYVRTQILLDKHQRKVLTEIADSTGVSLSELVRAYLNAQLRVRAYEQMQRAAEQLVDDYSGDQNLTEMTALDGEDFLHE